MKNLDEMARSYTEKVAKVNPIDQTLHGFVYTAYQKGLADGLLGEENACMTFGQALEHLKNGNRIGRASWRRRERVTFLWLKEPTRIKSEWCKDVVLKELADKNHGEIDALGTICQYDSNRDLGIKPRIVSGWIPTQEDLLAEDWIIVNTEWL